MGRRTSYQTRGMSTRDSERSTRNSEEARESIASRGVFTHLEEIGSWARNESINTWMRRDSRDEMGAPEQKMPRTLWPVKECVQAGAPSYLLASSSEIVNYLAARNLSTY